MRIKYDSVVGLVLHFRTPECTLNCLWSLANEGVGRAVLVDNSEDEGKSIEVMQSGLARLAQAGLSVEVLQPTCNLGFAAGVGIGLDYVSKNTSAAVLLINSDAILQPGALLAMYKLLPEHCLVVPRLARSSDQLGVSALAYYHRATALILRGRIEGAIAHPSGCCLLIRADQVRVDLFDTDFFFYGEDVMLGSDIARCGCGMAECMEATVVHAGSASAKNGSLFYEYHMARAHWLLAQKLARNQVERVIFIATRCLTLPVRACVRSVRGSTLIPWFGLFAATLDVLRGCRRSFTPKIAPSDSKDSSVA